ncbi:LCP family protein [Vagococcus sp. DIV0080]|uniref:LCP family protein n=1 Tax=Candidatus Vagococcus giribetii TaxID=2230876 RepID=A0ABS3HUT7_9ENTE|nr:LCP family protein [Vagococcus sp. DIV0080]MBO0477431.1 LCP family protein [Vagococcus sp. DIV0080]
MTKSKKNHRDKNTETLNTDYQTEYEPRSRRREPQKKKSILGVIGKSLIIILLVAVLSGIVYFVKGLMDTNNFLNNSYEPRKSSSVENDKIDVQKDPISVLILGLDDNSERDLGSARTDSMLLLTINPTTEKVDMVSIPRDTYTDIVSPSFTGKDKINSAYSYGGIDATIDSVEKLLNVPINYYATADFKAFEDIVDALGGVEIDVPFTLTEQNAKGEKVVDLKEGKQVLSGEEALAFSRTRYIDNDIERGKRQQQVLEAIAVKAMDIGTIAKYKNILEALDGHIKTDMPSNKILSVAQSGLTKNYKFESYAFSWMSYDYAPYGEAVSMVGLHQDSIDFISHRLRVSLGLDEKDERDAADYQFETNGVVAPQTFPDDGMAMVN